MGLLIENYVPVVMRAGLNTAKAVDFSAATSVALPAGTSIATGGILTSPVITAGLTASGSASNDFSGSTGTFKTSTGAVTIGTGTVAISGAVTFAADKGIVMTAGTGAMDFSLGTGIFKTTTGAVTIGNGAVSITGAVSIASGIDIVAAGGASDIDYALSSGIFKTPTGAATFGGSSNAFTNGITGTTISLTGAATHKSATAVPATAGAVAAGAPLVNNSNGMTIEWTTDTPTHIRPKGSVVFNINGSSTSTRMYIATDGAGTWTAVTTAA